MSAFLRTEPDPINEAFWHGVLWAQDGMRLTEHLMKYGITETLHPDAGDLMDRFYVALRAKLYQAQIKYGYTDDWKRVDPDVLRNALLEHVMKGDPRDVALYCAFLWDRGETLDWPMGRRP